MHTSQQYILCFGHDVALLNTRRQLLEKASFICVTTSDLRTAEKWLLTGKVGILVLCHTLMPHEVDEIGRSHHKAHSAASILRLPDQQWSLTLGDFGLVSEAQTDTAFLSAIRELSSSPRPSSGSPELDSVVPASRTSLPLR